MADRSVQARSQEQAVAMALRVTTRSAIHLVRGETSRLKWIAADGLSAAELLERLLAAQS
jgi:hypothetical protein